MAYTYTKWCHCLIQPGPPLALLLMTSFIRYNLTGECPQSSYQALSQHCILCLPGGTAVKHYITQTQSWHLPASAVTLPSWKTKQNKNNFLLGQVLWGSTLSWHLGCSHPILECLPLIHFPANCHPGKKQFIAHILESLPSIWET